MQYFASVIAVLCKVIAGPCKIIHCIPISEDYFKYLSRSFSLPNLTFTPLESLLLKEEAVVVTKDPFNYSDDFEIESEVPSPAKYRAQNEDDEDEVWHESFVNKDPATPATNIFAYLENQRATLEEKIGVGTLLKVYKMVAKLEQSDEERIDYSDLIKILGKGNEELIDDIIQLVVADQFFH